MEKEIVTDQSSKSESMTVGDEDQIGQLAEKQLSWKSDFPGQKANVRKADQMLASTGNKRICVWRLERGLVTMSNPSIILSPLPSHSAIPSLPCLSSPTIFSPLFFDFPSPPLSPSDLHAHTTKCVCILSFNAGSQAIRTKLQKDIPADGLAAP